MSTSDKDKIFLSELGLGGIEISSGKGNRIDSYEWMRVWKKITCGRMKVIGEETTKIKACKVTFICQK